MLRNCNVYFAFVGMQMDEIIAVELVFTVICLIDELVVDI